MPCAQCKEFLCKNIVSFVDGLYVEIFQHVSNKVIDIGSLWCSKKCRNDTPNWKMMIKSDEFCLECRQDYPIYGKDFCKRECEERAQNNTPIYPNFQTKDEKFKDISNQILFSWKYKNKPIPNVYAVYKIFPNHDLVTKYNDYRNYVENRRDFGYKGRPFPNDARK
ncbi:8295_t:CDS:2 [Gigaspora margarita]|uniref:8295_t:CDS:1 n=1 Tax=Gigaspora margarita TaxID=4874 RepID=A0ABN7V5N3_GIGMA|nr:8295_t:CDS:2 [Gigaspora margarita]